jgi:signal transduction histidine kinase
MLRALGGLAWIVAGLLVGWLVSEGLWAITGRPPAFAAYLAAVGICVAGTMAFGRLFAAIRGKRPGRPDLGEQILDALERISQGDFDVRLSATRPGPFRAVVESVNKMAAELGTLEHQRQEFVSNVSHEIGSPLTSVIGFARLLRDQDLDRDTQRHYLDVIVQEAERVSKLGENLLRLSALDDAAWEPRRHRVDEALGEVVVLLEPQWSAKSLTVELDAEAVEWAGDREMMHQVWVNLLQNAIKFTPEGGAVTVVLRQEGAGWTCRVRDTGIGIAPGDLPHVFERFFRADKARSQGGNGLGLALAKRIVELGGGRVAVASEVGRGAEFSVHMDL